MKLEQYIHALGMTELDFLHKAGVPHKLAHSIDRGMPIAESYAQKLCTFLTQEFKRPIQIKDISDLKTC